MIAPTTNTKRIVATGMFGPRAICLNVAPDFGSTDEWSAAMQSAVDAAPEPYYTKLLDDEWVVAVEEEITRNPAAIPFAVEPEVMARYDSQLGLPCQPYERGYRKLADIEQYIIFWKDTDATMRAMAAEHAEYVDALDEISWLRTGF